MARSGAIKGITIKLGADTSELTTSLRKTEKSLQTTQKQLTEVNRALKFNPGNVELLRQKEELLNSKIKDTNSSLEDMKKALDMMDAKGIEKTSNEYMSLQREIIETESKQQSFNEQLKQVRVESSSMYQLGNKLEGVGAKLDTIAQKAQGVAMVCGGAALAIGGLAYKSAAGADDINTLAKVTGISTDKLQIYAQAADLVDVSVEAIAKAQTKMKKSMASAQKGTGATAEAFAQLGVNVTNADGSLRDQEDVFQEVLEKLGTMQNATERDALAMQIFGRSATELNPLIEDCGETYKNVIQAFDENDIEVVDQKTLDEANRFNDAIDKIKATGSQALFSLGANLAEKLAPAMEKVSGLMQKLAGHIANMNPNVLIAIGIIATLVGGLSIGVVILAKVISSVGIILQTLPMVLNVIRAISGALMANPVGLVIAGIVTLITVLVLAYKHSKKFREIVNGLGKAILAIPKKIKEFATAVKETLVKAFKKVTDIGKNIVKGIWNGISNGLGWIKKKLTGWIGNVKKFIKKLFGIHSPSKWARDIVGYNIVAGMAEGVTGSARLLDRAMASVMPNSVPTIGGMAAEMSNAVGTGLAVANTGGAGMAHITVNLGGAKVAEQIVNLYDTAKRQVG